MPASVPLPLQALSPGAVRHDQHRQPISSQNAASKRRVAVLEGRAGLRQPTPVKLSEHVKAYLAPTEKTNRSALANDKRVLDGFLASVGDKLITEVFAFLVERRKQQRAELASRSSANRELNVVRGCYSRAVEWGALVSRPYDP